MVAAFLGGTVSGPTPDRILFQLLLPWVQGVRLTWDQILVDIVVHAP